MSFVNTVDLIGDEALTASIIDKSITEISDKLCKSIGYDVFRGCLALTMVNFSEVTTVGDYALINCSSLTDVNLPKATTIGKSAFSGCSALTNVSLPKATTLAFNTFTNCSSLTVVDLPELTTAGNDIFRSCSALTDVNLPKVTTIGTYAFSSCSALTNVNLPNMTTIDKSAFSSCSALTDINLPKATTIGRGAFTNCTSLWLVDLPELTAANAEMFSGCSVLTDVNLPKVTTLGSNAFTNCSSLAVVNLPKVTTIDFKAFYGCSSLVALCLRSESVCSLTNTDSFAKSLIESGQGYIYVPSALVNGYRMATNWSTYANQFRALEDYTVDGTITGELDITRRRVRFYNEDGTFLGYVMVPYGGNATYLGDEPVKEGAWAFKGWNPEPISVTADMDCYAKFVSTAVAARRLVERTLDGDYVNGTVKIISDYAFYKCSALESVDFAMATTVGTYAFNLCDSLTTADLPEVTSIGTFAFYRCGALTSVDLSSVTTLDNYAFESCSNLTSVDLPVVTALGNSVFGSCSVLDTLILRNTSNIVSLSNSNSLANTKIYGGTGYIYVPSSLIDQYKSATNWSTYANQFRALESYTIDGTVNGKLDTTKI